ncbi:hypothetical protein [Streptomyces sp. RKAG337]|uniref:hypothetical protein n=1 Tax=Streptomyces sp. RKAG337 TaxID=2893404 RepID=UPI0020333BFE|nr:hypothetical protein [Streptomyces sp. RKAG337]MCM2425092.1 hypothetical protein [Streptomyces sp. RKAG337]
MAKFAKYQRFFQLQTKDAAGIDYPVWRTMYAATGREGYPPIAVVFNGRMSTDALYHRMRQVKELSQEYWQGRYHAPYDLYGKAATDGYWDHRTAIPVIVTTLEQLAQRGPHAPIWWRYGHEAWEPILTALANPDNEDAYRVREQERRRQEEERDRLRQAECDRQIEQDAVRERRRKKEKKRMRALIALWNEAAGALQVD